VITSAERSKLESEWIFGAAGGASTAGYRDHAEKAVWKVEAGGYFG
jgi:hypothetical protein